MKIAFDVDDTLIIPSVVTGLPFETPNYKTIAVFKWFQAQGHDMIVWSGSGVDWAKTWAERLNLQPCTIRVKGDGDDIDICFDDCDVKLAKVNVKVKRVNNQISRKEWNETKRPPEKEHSFKKAEKKDPFRMLDVHLCDCGVETRINKDKLM